MIEFSLIGAALVAITVVIHALGTTVWLRYIGVKHALGDEPWTTRRSLIVLTSTVIVLIVLHTIEIGIWAIAYLSLVSVEELETLESALYFSFVTFTTLGYGDITLAAPWRVLSGIEALNGIMLVGWTTAFLFAVVQRSWKGTLQTRSD
ncbi:MAG: potassium channel family protein [Woeseiaceae bacterium]